VAATADLVSFEYMVFSSKEKIRFVGAPGGHDRETDWTNDFG
jgi:hypothetical protein